MPRSNPSAKRDAACPQAVARIAQTCRQAVAGKLAVRQLTRWVDGHSVSETEFRLLWELFAVDARLPATHFDQAALADRLAVSAAQISGVVERLRRMNFACPHTGDGDRRRQLWQLTAAGEQLVRQIIATVGAATSDDDAGKEAA